MKLTLFFTLFLGLSFGQISKKACFIGNSYTFYNDLPDLVEGLASSDGNSFYADQHTPGGSTLEQHSTNATTLNKIALDDWDYVVLQDQSQRPSFPWTQVHQEVFPFAEVLCDSIRAANSCAKPLFFNTWGRRDGDAQWDSINTFDKMNERLFNAYEYMALENSAKRSPVGIGFDHVHNDANAPISHADLYTADGSHPSVLGSYLAACFFYELIFDQSSVGNTYMPNGVGTSQGFYLQTVAHHILNDVDSVKTDFSIPRASFDYTVDDFEVSFVNQSQHSFSWTWDFGDGSSSSLENPIHDFQNSGVYDVTLTSEYCGAFDDTTISVLLSSAHISEYEQNNFNLFPNPSNGKVIIDYQGSEQNGLLLSELGQEIRQFKLTNPQLNLKTGRYIIRIGNTVKRLIIK